MKVFGIVFAALLCASCGSFSGRSNALNAAGIDVAAIVESNVAYYPMIPLDRSIGNLTDANSIMTPVITKKFPFVARWMPAYRINQTIVIEDETGLCIGYVMIGSKYMGVYTPR